MRPANLYSPVTTLDSVDNTPTRNPQPGFGTNAGNAPSSTIPQTYGKEEGLFNSYADGNDELNVMMAIIDGGSFVSASSGWTMVAQGLTAVAYKVSQPSDGDITDGVFTLSGTQHYVLSQASYYVANAPPPPPPPVITVTCAETGQSANDGRGFTLSKQISNRVWATGEDQSPTSHFVDLDITTAGTWSIAPVTGLLVEPSRGTGNETVRIWTDERSLPQVWRGHPYAQSGSYLIPLAVRAGTGETVSVDITINIGYGSPVGNQ